MFDVYGFHIDYKFLGFLLILLLYLKYLKYMETEVKGKIWKCTISNYQSTVVPQTLGKPDQGHGHEHVEKLWSRSRSRSRRDRVRVRDRDRSGPAHA